MDTPRPLDIEYDAEFCGYSVRLSMVHENPKAETDAIWHTGYSKYNKESKMFGPRATVVSYNRNMRA